MMCLMSDYGVMTLQTQSLMGFELTRSPTPCEFDDNNQGLSLLEWRIEAVFSFLCRSPRQDHLLGHNPCFPSFWVHLTHNKRTKKVQSRFLSLCKSLIWTLLFRRRLVSDLCVLLGPQRKILAHPDTLIYHERWSHRYMQWCQGIYCLPGVITYIGTSIWWHGIWSKHRKVSQI